MTMENSSKIEVKSFKELKRKHDGEINGIIVFKNLSLVVSCSDVSSFGSLICVWDLKTTECIQTIKYHKDDVNHIIKFGPKGTCTFISCSEDVKIASFTYSKESRKFQPNTFSFSCDNLSKPLSLLNLEDEDLFLCHDYSDKIHLGSFRESRIFEESLEVSDSIDVTNYTSRMKLSKLNKDHFFMNCGTLNKWIVCCDWRKDILIEKYNIANPVYDFDIFLNSQNDEIISFAGRGEILCDLGIGLINTRIYTQDRNLGIKKYPDPSSSRPASSSSLQDRYYIYSIIQLDDENIISGECGDCTNGISLFKLPHTPFSGKKEKLEKLNFLGDREIIEMGVVIRMRVIEKTREFVEIIVATEDNDMYITRITGLNLRIRKDKKQETMDLEERLSYLFDVDLILNQDDVFFFHSETKCKFCVFSKISMFERNLFIPKSFFML